MAPVKQPGGKIITAYAVRGDLDVTHSRSNTFELEWPKGSGKVKEYPEVDRAGWFAIDTARSKLLKGQLPLLDRLLEHLAAAG
jgi:predicted NUDIX family NTP pyrophosphohydrolase